MTMTTNAAAGGAVQRSSMTTDALSDIRPDAERLAADANRTGGYHLARAAKSADFPGAKAIGSPDRDGDGHSPMIEHRPRADAPSPRVVWLDPGSGVLGDVDDYVTEWDPRLR